jgi:serine/threonine protein kinase
MYVLHTYMLICLYIHTYECMCKNMCIGRGGFGEVREGTNHLSGETVALKFLKRSEIQSMGAVERTANEIQCLATLKHKNIICLHMHLETPQYIVLAFELMKGGDLYRYMTNRGMYLHI